MKRVVQWTELESHIEPHAPKSTICRQPLAQQNILCQSKKGNRRFSGMKAHVGVDAESGLVQTVQVTAGHLNELTQANSAPHDQETVACAEAGYQGAHNGPDAEKGVTWLLPMKPGKRLALDKSRTLARLVDQVMRHKAGVRAKVEHPFRLVKRQLGHVKVRDPGLAKNTVPSKALFAPANLWLALNELIGPDGQSCLTTE